MPINTKIAKLIQISSYSVLNEIFFKGILPSAIPCYIIILVIHTYHPCIRRCSHTSLLKICYCNHLRDNNANWHQNCNIYFYSVVMIFFLFFKVCYCLLSFVTSWSGTQLLSNEESIDLHCRNKFCNMGIRARIC